MKILFIGSFSERSISRIRFEWMQRLGHEVFSVDYDRYFPFKRGWPLWKRVEQRLGYGPSFLAVNREVLSAVKRVKPEVLWIEKGVFLFPRTVAACKNWCGVIASFHPDDPFTRRGGKIWRHHLAGIRHYDVCFLATQAVVMDYRGLGAKYLYQFFHSYDPLWIRPLLKDLEISDLEKSVIFVGHFEPERGAVMEAVHQFTPRLFVSGWGWGQCRSLVLQEAGVLHDEGLWGDDYAAAFSQAGIALNVLTRNHRDLSTTRSFEIPACGGFMLAERTVEHLLLFREGVEAEFWGDLEELQDKVKYYLAHPEEARAIGQRGRERCLKSGYGLDKCIPRWLAYAQNPKGTIVSDFEGLFKN